MHWSAEPSPPKYSHYLAGGGRCHPLLWVCIDRTDGQTKITQVITVTLCLCFAARVNNTGHKINDLVYSTFIICTPIIYRQSKICIPLRLGQLEQFTLSINNSHRWYIKGKHPFESGLATYMYNNMTAAAGTALWLSLEISRESNHHAVAKLV